MSEREPRDHVRTFLFAGHETTAMTLVWATYLVFTHPQVERRLVAEVDEVLEGRRPTGEDLKRLPYTYRVLQETLRLYPSAPFVGRQTIGEDTLRGYRVPAGTGVTLCSYVTHRHPGIWKDPERFDPERFDPERCAERAHYAYFPFGGGPRRCIGSDFALQEALLALVMTMQRCRFELDPSRPFAPAIRTVRPRDGLWMRPQSRRARPPQSAA
jgi:cytochrome P450